MKKFLYTMFCCATLAGGALYAADSLLGTPVLRAEGDTETRQQLYVGSPSYVSSRYNPENDHVVISFTTPNYIATYPDYNDVDVAKLDFVYIYRNEGTYNDPDTRVLLHTFTDLDKYTDYTWEDDGADLEFGKTYYYYVLVKIDNDTYYSTGSGDGTRCEYGPTADPATDFKVTPGDKGAPEATVSFKAPTTCNDGAKTITDKIETIYISRKLYNDYYGDDVTIKMFSDVEPGAELSYTDKDPSLEEGEMYTYRAVIVYKNRTTRNYTNSADVVIGTDKPGRPTDVTAEAMEDGNVKVTWTAPAAGLQGGYFDPSTVTYKVERGIPAGYSAQYTVIATGLTACEYLDEGITEEGTYIYQITACNGDVEGGTEVSGRVSAGPPAPMPYAESWPRGTAQHSTWTFDSPWTEYTSFTLYDSEYNDIATITGADGDGGFILLYTSTWSSEVGQECPLVSGRIDFTKAVKPALFFQFFDIDPEISDNTFKVFAAKDGGEWQELTGLDFESLPGLNQWVKMQADLTSFIGAEYIQIKFVATLGSKLAKGAIDNVEIRDILPADVAVKSASLPAKFYHGAGMNVTVNLANEGDEPTEAGTLTLKAGDVTLASADCPAIPGYGKLKLEIPVQISESLPSGENELIASVDVQDACTDNNSAAAAFEVVALPAPADLKADGKVLTWTEAGELPFNDGNKTVDEDFASYEHGTTGEFGGWTVIDVDKLETYKIPGCENDRPGVQASTGAMVLSATEMGASWSTPDEANPNSLIFCAAIGQSDDWLISPELTGLEQTVTFKAMAPASYGAEKFSVMVSSSDTEIASFTELEAKSVSGSAGAKWEDFSFVLPDGTKYFAIRYTSYYGDGLAMTDFHFITGAGLTSEPTALLGYNIYCDGAKINEEPLAANTYELLTTHPAGNYTVKAAYNNAESAATEPVYVMTDGIAAIDSDAAIEVIGSELVFRGNFLVADLAGRIVAQGDGPARIAVAPGVYVVTADKSSFKISIK